MAVLNLSGRALRPGALGLAIVLAACGPQPTSSGQACLKTNEGETIDQVAWTNAGSRLIIQTRSGPFGQKPDQTTFTELSWPERETKRTVAAPQAHGAVITASGGIFWLDDSGIWWWEASTGQARKVVDIPTATQVVQSWAVAKDEIVVMRADQNNEIVRYDLNGGPASTWLASDADAYRLWSSEDGATIIVTRGSATSEAPAEFEIHRADGSVTSVSSGVGLPIVRWLSRDGGWLVFQDSGKAVYRIRATGASSSPERMDAIAAGVGALSAPAPSGLVAFAGGGTGPSTICFADSIPSELMP